MGLEEADGAPERDLWPSDKPLARDRLYRSSTLWISRLVVSSWDCVADADADTDADAEADADAEQVEAAWLCPLLLVLAAGDGLDVDVVVATAVVGVVGFEFASIALTTRWETMSN